MPLSRNDDYYSVLWQAVLINDLEALQSDCYSIFVLPVYSCELYI